ncbi:hypothetical protein VKT23_006052 [Stygiomarasmius scandens]|uniref:Uncharacterized protein n=1 Tax=Marasmiellus scandens TaxID=2682957 RepID=A0ABR1JPX4_9AGAR
MYIPFTSNDDSTSTGEAGLEFFGPQCGTTNCAFIAVFFMLLFYALALWDRWMNLRSKELERLRLNQNNARPAMTNYGATLKVPSPTPKYKFQERSPYIDVAANAKSQYLAVPPRSVSPISLSNSNPNTQSC